MSTPETIGDLLDRLGVTSTVTDGELVSAAARRPPAGRIRISRTGPRTRPWKMRCNTCGIAVHHPTHPAAITLADDHGAMHQRLEGSSST